VERFIARISARPRDAEVSSLAVQSYGVMKIWFLNNYACSFFTVTVSALP
jgi:hypothetical protein